VADWATEHTLPRLPPNCFETGTQIAHPLGIRPQAAHGNVLTTKANETTLNIAQVLSGESLKLLFPDPLSDPTPPDIIIVPNPGTTYEPATQVLAEHGGFNENDVHVPLLVIHVPSITPGQVRALVTTTQIAPTILTLLGLDPNQLDAVKIEGVKALPSVVVHADQGVSPH